MKITSFHDVNTPFWIVYKQESTMVFCSQLLFQQTILLLTAASWCLVVWLTYQQLHITISLWNVVDKLPTWCGSCL